MIEQEHIGCSRLSDTAAVPRHTVQKQAQCSTHHCYISVPQAIRDCCSALISPPVYTTGATILMAVCTQSHQPDSLYHIGGTLPIDRAVRQRWRASIRDGQGAPANSAGMSLNEWAAPASRGCCTHGTHAAEGGKWFIASACSN